MARRPSGELIGWTAGAALASSQMFAPYLPDRFSIERALIDAWRETSWTGGRPDTPQAALDVVCSLRRGYVPWAAMTALIAGVSRVVTGSWWPAAASAGATALGIAQYESVLPPEIRLDPASALISGLTRQVPITLPTTNAGGPRVTIFEARRGSLG